MGEYSTPREENSGFTKTVKKRLLVSWSFVVSTITATTATIATENNFAFDEFTEPRDRRQYNWPLKWRKYRWLLKPE